MKFISYAALAAALPAFPAFAQQAPTVDSPAAVESGGGAGADAPPAPGDAAKAHAKDDDDDAIVVTGVKRSGPDVLGGVSVLDPEELAHDLKPSLGDVLTDLPGVSASSFGPSSSRPILRGLSGERDAVLIDGISSLDLSSTDPDHAVTINPLTARRIEVLRGPGALLYTSSAIGGVVNVIDGRIPRSHPDHVSGDLLSSYGTAAKERSGNVGIDAPLGGHFVAHVDGSYSKYDDLHVGGFLLSEPLRRQALASPDSEIRALANLKDKLPNTAGRADDIAGGLAYIDGDLDVGISYSHHDAKYGVPIRFSLDSDVEAEEPTIDAHQDRGDIRANIPIGGFFKGLEFRGGISRYRHAELEADGTIGTRFYSHGSEFRAELVQNQRGGWGGTSGIQYLNQDARIRGTEKYLPDSTTRNVGLFTLQSLAEGPFRLEAAGRLDFARLHAAEDEQIAENGGLVGSVPISRSFAAVSASFGANYEILKDWRLGLSLSHVERAPSAQELFSNGPHGGSEQFLIGDPNLRIEKSNGAELSLRRTTGPVRVEANFYYSRYSNFIYQVPTGVIEDGLPVYQQGEGKADYYGFELDVDPKFGKAFGIDWSGDFTTDAVRVKIRNFGNAPEIPPFRVLAGLIGTRGQVDGRVEVEHVSAQDKTAPNETRTPGYNMVNLSFDWHVFAANPALTLSLTANNFFDVDARRHSSDLKDYAPLAGRDIRLSARLGF